MDDELYEIVRAEVERQLEPLRAEIADLQRRVEILEAQKARTLEPCLN